MGQKEKLIKKLKSRPKDFTFDEAETLLGYSLMVVQTKDEPAVPVSCLSAMSMPQSYCVNRTHEKNCWIIK